MEIVFGSQYSAPHLDRLGSVPGAYEWWYLDAVSNDHVWSLACIWFLGNPFSPYYRLALHGIPASPLGYNALMFAVYQNGKLFSYHFTKLPENSLQLTSETALSLCFGKNILKQTRSGYDLKVTDTNGNGRRIVATLSLGVHAGWMNTVDSAGPLEARQEMMDDHCWQPVAPSGQLTGQISIRGPQSYNDQIVRFDGTGYLDHNWGSLPFDEHISCWYWARASFEGGMSAIVYFISYTRPQPPTCTLLVFESGQLTLSDRKADVSLSRSALNIFGLHYRKRISVSSGGVHVHVDLGSRLDSSPFYIRALAQMSLSRDGARFVGAGIGEYFRPKHMGTWIASSAMKARVASV